MVTKVDARNSLNDTYTAVRGILNFDNNCTRLRVATADKVSRSFADV